MKFFLERLFSRGKDLRALGKIRIAVIGPSTADALAGYHLNADLVADSSRSEGLLEQLSGIAAGSRILLARADRGRTLLQDELCKITDVEQIAVYHNQDADLISTHALDRIRDGTFDWITVTSSAIVNRLHAALPQGARERIGRDINLASISPLTTEAARRHGWPVAVEAKVHTWDGLIDALVSQVNNERP